MVTTSRARSNEIPSAKINAIFAIERNGGIGRGNRLPWTRNRNDMRLFRHLTENEIVIMGRATWDAEDMIRPLANRVNVILTTHQLEDVSSQKIDHWRSPIIQASGSIDVVVDLVSTQHPYRNIWVIGGAEVLYQSAHLHQQVYITRFDEDYPCDTRIDLDRILGKGQQDFELVHTEFLEENYSIRQEVWRRKIETVS